MSLPTSKTEIISLAALLLGQSSIVDLEKNPKTQAASKIYDNFYADLLTKYEWNFALRVQKLAKLTEEAPLIQFKNQFQIPFDSVLVRTTDPVSNYQIFDDKIFSNLNELTIIYHALVTEANLPSYFIMLLVYSMAELLAMPFTQNIQLLEAWGQKAKAQFTRAMSIDSQSRTSIPFVRDQFTAAHNIT